MPEKRYKLEEVYPDARTHALGNSLVGLALPVPDAVDGGGGDYPSPSQPDAVDFLLCLRGGA